ncbi:MAG: hypothetical protein DCC46_02590 [Armatimonadetes bacterium]|nr:MAG: hypothetical protein DCC46_02590 [Armatimonadota bacterium]
MFPESTQPYQAEESCVDVRDLLHALIENDLDEDDAKWVLQHLAECDECREALKQHAKLSGLVLRHLPWLGMAHFGQRGATAH